MCTYNNTAVQVKKQIAFPVRNSEKFYIFFLKSHDQLSGYFVGRLTVNIQDNFLDVSPWSIALLRRAFRDEYSGRCGGSLTLDYLDFFSWRLAMYDPDFVFSDDSR